MSRSPSRSPSARPPGLIPPPHLSPSPPVPAPEPVVLPPDPDGALSPTRYGDWEKKGIAIDF